MGVMGVKTVVIPTLSGAKGRDRCGRAAPKRFFCAPPALTGPSLTLGVTWP